MTWESPIQIPCALGLAGNRNVGWRAVALERALSIQDVNGVELARFELDEGSRMYVVTVNRALVIV